MDMVHLGQKKRSILRGLDKKKHYFQKCFAAWQSIYILKGLILTSPKLQPDPKSLHYTSRTVAWKFFDFFSESKIFEIEKIRNSLKSLRKIEN